MILAIVIIFILYFIFYFFSSCFSQLKGLSAPYPAQTVQLNDPGMGIPMTYREKLFSFAESLRSNLRDLTKKCCMQSCFFAPGRQARRK